MNKHFTLLAAALMTVGTFTAANAADDNPSKDWTAGNYYYLKNGSDKYLSLDGNKSDSVVVKAIPSFVDVNKAARDSALWEIVGINETAGTVYQFKNKKTNAVLSFAASQEAKPILVAGVDKWTFTDGGGLSASLSDGSKMILALNDDGSVAFTGEALDLTVTEPDTMTMTPQDLGDGFSTFQLIFDDKYEGNIFTGKDLIANSVGNNGFMTLQVKGDEAYSNGVKKFLGVDTLKTTINNQQNVFGAGFALDSTRKVLRPNELCQHFKFVVNLQNDSIAMFVAGAPDFDDDLKVKEAEGDTVRVVYAQTGNTKVLTVSKFGANAQPIQGKLPMIGVAKGTPVTIPTGSGVYFLKKVSKGADNGKYYVAKKAFMGGDSVPSVNQVRGQWYIKENNGKYSIVDRESDSDLILDKEVFAVQGMEDTYLIGSDSITVEQMNVDLKNKYLGSFVASEQDLVNKGYYLSLFSATPGVPELFMYASDSILKGSAVDMQLFKLFPMKPVKVAGAKQLGDTVSVIPYQLGGYFLDGKVAKDEEKGVLKFSTTSTPLSFRFLSDANGQFYSMATDADNKYVGIDVNTSNLQLTSTKTIVNIAPVDAPEYATFEAGHKRLVSDGNSLVMNPLNLFAQMKTEGSEITKATYEKDNFSLWVEPDTMVAGKQLYLISSGSETGTRYYMSVKDTSFTGINYDKYAMFVEDNDTIKTMKDSPALFAFKVNEHGGYLLENYKELKNGGKPYVGVVNGFVVLEQFPHVAFEVETASAPTPNEEINVSEIKVISSDGQVIVTNASGKKITLSNILGQTIGVRRASSEYFSMPATSGIVLVTVEGDTTYKVIVK